MPITQISHKIIKHYRIKIIKHYIKSGDLHAAEAKLEHLLKKENQNIWALRKYAIIATSREDWKEAVERWEKVIEVADKADKELLSAVIRNLKKTINKYYEVLQKNGQAAEAERQLHKLIALEPDNLQVRTRLADLYFAQENWPAAFKEWDSIIDEAEMTEKSLPPSNEVNIKFYERYNKSGLLVNKDYLLIEKVQEYWIKNYGTKIDPSLHLAFYNLTGEKEPRIIPRSIMWNEIIPYFNDKKMNYVYSDKNIYDRLIYSKSGENNVLKRVHSIYFDANNNCLSSKQAFSLLVAQDRDLIIKPSRTDNGLGIRKLNNINKKMYLEENVVEIKDLEKLYGSNYLVQNIIEQHPVMAAPHPQSVNTLRILTFRWKNDLLHLLTFARFGTGGSVRDNAGRGGLCCGVTADGHLMDYAIDEHTTVYTHHPTSNYCFADQAIIPNYDHFVKFALDLHKNILHFDLISWDIVVGKDGQPVFLEANYKGATWLYQLSVRRPLFGDLTEEVLQLVSSEIKKDINIRNMIGTIDRDL